MLHLHDKLTLFDAVAHFGPSGSGAVGGGGTGAGPGAGEPGGAPGGGNAAAGGVGGAASPAGGPSGAGLGGRGVTSNPVSTGALGIDTTDTALDLGPLGNITEQDMATLTARAAMPTGVMEGARGFAEAVGRGIVSAEDALGITGAASPVGSDPLGSPGNRSGRGSTPGQSQGRGDNAPPDEVMMARRRIARGNNNRNNRNNGNNTGVEEQGGGGQVRSVDFPPSDVRVNQARQRFQDFAEDRVGNIRNRVRSRFADALRNRGLEFGDTLVPGGPTASDVFNRRFGTQIGNNIAQPDNIRQFLEFRGDPQRGGRFFVDNQALMDEVTNQINFEPSRTNFDDVLDEIEGNVGQRLDEQAQTAFENVDVGQTANIDQVIDDILQERRGRATDVIENQLGRGVLSDQGAEAARSALDTQGTIAEADLGNIGRSVSEALGQQVRSRVQDSGLLTPSENFSLGDDVTSPRDNIRGVVEDVLGDTNVEGQIRSNLGDAPLFDPNQAITRGGIAQGQINTGGERFIDVMQRRRENQANARAAQSQRQDRQTERGLGTQGSF